MSNEMKASMEIISNPIPERLASLAAGLPSAVEKVMEFNANDGQNFMRANAPWIDRTGNARQGLFARNFTRGPLKYTIILWHSVPYGIWLELAHDRKYKIIEPAWRKTSQNVMQDLNHLMRILP
jgi:hypothetical protein